MSYSTHDLDEDRCVKLKKLALRVCPYHRTGYLTIEAELQKCQQWLCYLCCARVQNTPTHYAPCVWHTHLFISQLDTFENYGCMKIMDTLLYILFLSLHWDGLIYLCLATPIISTVCISEWAPLSWTSAFLPHAGWLPLADFCRKFLNHTMIWWVNIRKAQSYQI